MSSTFSLYRSLAAPASITHSVSCNLCGPQSRDLIVVRHDCIELYSISETAAAAAASDNSGLSDQSLMQRVCARQMYGRIEDVSAVRLPGWNRDVLLLASPHSKLSLLAWDAPANDLVTLAIWTQDEDVVGAAAVAAAKSAQQQQHAAHSAGGHLAPSPLMLQAKHYMAPKLRVDPSNRCAALVTYDNFLIGFDLTRGAQMSAPSNPHAHAQHSGVKQEPQEESKEATVQPMHSGVATSTGGSHSFHAASASALSPGGLVGAGMIPTLSASSIYSLASLRLGYITDLQFLHGFQDPTLLILHEPRRNWAGRAATVQGCSQQLVVTSFNTTTREFTSPRVSNSTISFDCHSLVSIPKPLGGALVVGMNCVWHWNDNLDFTLTCNALGDDQAIAGLSGKMPHVRSAYVMTMDLSFSTWICVNSERASAFLVNKRGETFLLHITPQGNGGVKSMALEALGLVSVPQGVVRVVSAQPLSASISSNPHAQRNFVFVWSRMGPSQLIEYRRFTEDERKQLREERRIEEAALAEEARVAAAAAAGLSGVAAPAAGVVPLPSLRAQLDAAASSESKPSSESFLSALDDDDDDNPYETAKPAAAATPAAVVAPTPTPAAAEPVAAAAAAAASSTEEGPPSKRSRTDAVAPKKPVTDSADAADEEDLMDVFGFSAEAQGVSAAEADAAAAAVAAVALAPKTAAENFLTAEALPAENTPAADVVGPDGAPLLDAAAVEAKEAEAYNLKVAAAKEEARRLAMQRAFADEHELRFWVRDRLSSSVSGPAHDMALSYVLPAEEDARLEAEEREQAIADEAAKRQEKDVVKATTDEEERVQAAQELAELAELEKRWRAKERRSRVVEMIQLAGYEQSGAIILSNEGIVPEELATLPLEQPCVGCWTLRPVSAPGVAVPSAHSFLLLSTAQSTLVFRTGDGVQQLVDLETATNNAYSEFLVSRGVQQAQADWSQVKDSQDAMASAGVYAELTPAVRAELDRNARFGSDHPFDGARTIAAGNLSFAKGGDESKKQSLIVQVTPRRVRLIGSGPHGPVVLEDEPISSNDDLVCTAAHVESPFVVLHLSDLSVRLLSIGIGAHHPTKAGKLTLCDGPLDKINELHSALPDPVGAVCLFKDSTLARSLKKAKESAQGTDSAMEDKNAAPAAAAAAASSVDDMDDLDRLLGGESAAAAAAASAEAATPAASSVGSKPDLYMALASYASIEIWSLSNPTPELVYNLPRFPLGRRVIEHVDPSVAAANGHSASALDPLEFPLGDLQLPDIVDLFLGSVGDTPEAQPTLMAFLENGDLLAYQAFVAPAAGGKQVLRWVRQETPVLTRPSLNQADSATAIGSLFQTDSSLGKNVDPAVAAAKAYRDAFGIAKRAANAVAKPSTRFQRFSHLGSSDCSNGKRAGVLIAGTKPLFVFADRTAVRMHPLISEWRAREDGASFETEEDVEENEDEPAVADKRKEGVVCSAPFEYAFPREDGTTQQAFGFITIDAREAMRICKLHPAQRAPNHALHMSERRLTVMGLASPLLTSLSSHSTLSPSIAPSPAVVDYDSTLLRRVVHLGATPRFLARHIPTSTTAVVVSRQVRIPSKELESDRSVANYADQYEVLLFHSRSWELIGRYAQFDPQEIVLTCTSVTMGFKSYIALGTSSFQGEDVQCRGRIVLIDLFFGMGNSAQGELVKLLRIKVYSQAEKLPVSLLQSMPPNIMIAGEGSRIILYAHTGRQLVGKAFFDCGHWITSLASLNNFILYGDVALGVGLLYYDPTLRTLNALGRSHEHFHATSTEFLLDYRALNLIAGDQNGNLHTLRFQPNTPGHGARGSITTTASAGGVQFASYENAHVASHPTSNQNLGLNPFTQTSMLGGYGYKLNLKGDFHVGERIGKMIKMKLRARAAGAAGAVATTDAGGVVAKPLQSYLLLVSYSGAIAQLLPVDQVVFRRLSTLAMHLAQTKPSLGGLHPLGYRLFQSPSPSHPHCAKKVLDFGLVLDYVLLDLPTQWRLAKFIGTTPAQIVDNIKRVVWATQMH